MNQGLQTYDYIVFVLYFILISSYGIWIYRKKNTNTTNTKDFFLAEGQLTWWAIGASLIASNISAEQFIGMSGNGFRLGLAISVYEWLAAVSLVVVAIFFMPVYLKNKIYTMPQFLKTRYNETVAMIMAIFWLFLYIFVNLTSILYLGAIAINNLSGGTHFHLIMIGLAVFALFITLGGMKVIGYTDVFQVLVLTVGGLITSYIALTVVSEQFGMGKNMVAGFQHLMQAAPDHFKMIFDKPGPGATQKEIEDYSSLPGMAMMVAGIWVAHLNYWGCNQYITQRALGADLKTARTGILFAAFLKLMMPILVVVPGIAAYVLYQNGGLQTQMMTNGVLNQDNAYSAVVGFLPVGLKGLSMAALTAAIVASLAGKANSISTIYSLDIYKKYINKDASDKKIVTTGRVIIILSLLIAIIINWKDTLGIGGKGGFEFIQKYTGYISPAIFPVFLLGFFWKKATSRAAISGIFLGVVLSIVFDKFLPGWMGNDTLLYTAYPTASGSFEIPYLIQMGWVFCFTTLAIIIVSLLDVKGQKHENDITEDQGQFKLSNAHLAMAMLVLGVVIALYIKFW
ncbi:MAG: sodium/solute symporter [Chitinophagaceae bacterium]|nr:sodium/solute symporter [Chitinophagaceae bacterium]MCF8288898.1 sodium/solute symporter [Chitinophagaceae bacterium]MCF8421674.1 sodium/solute symporter [Chitinophagaceae bacterium]